jgi:hypothetical protein
MAVLTYRVHFATTGRYYVWARLYSTGGEDNGLHVGIDGSWPSSGQRMQWCNGKRSWWWESKQRTDANHCGEPGRIFLDVDTPGEHTIMVSMREDGTELDKWLMTTDASFSRPADAGPAERVKSGTVPPPVTAPSSPARFSIPATDFLFGTTYFRPYEDWIAIQGGAGPTDTVGQYFPGASGTYDLTLYPVTEPGSAKYILLVDGDMVGMHQGTPTPGPSRIDSAGTATWTGVPIEEGATISIQGFTGLDAHAAWASIAFYPSIGSFVGSGVHYADALRCGPLSSASPAVDPLGRAVRHVPRHVPAATTVVLSPGQTRATRVR